MVRRRIQTRDPAVLLRLLDSRVRLALQPPEVVVDRSGVGEGMAVLDLGCGVGTLTIPLARAVGPAGMVYAVDLNGRSLEVLRRKLERPENSDVRGRIETLRASATDLPLKDGSIDACVAVAVIQEIPDRVRALREVWRVLRPGGTLAVFEVLLDPDYALRSTTVRLGEEAGFEVDAVLGNFWSYTVRFSKPRSGSEGSSWGEFRPVGSGGKKLESRRLPHPRDR